MPMFSNWFDLNQSPGQPLSAVTNIWHHLERRSAPLILGFINVLAKEAVYDLATIESVILPALKHLMITHGGERMSVELTKKIRLAIKQLRTHDGVRFANSGPTNNPCTIYDIRVIISRTPDGFLDKELEASLWLISVSTGARAVTVSNVYVVDIVHVQVLASGLCRVVIVYNVTKGCRKWNHRVTIEGFLDRRSDTNPIYWLDRYLIKCFGLHLRHYESWNKGRLRGKKLWDLSDKSMQYRFSLRAELAGYPKGFFTFHSIR